MTELHDIGQMFDLDAADGEVKRGVSANTPKLSTTTSTDRPHGQRIRGGLGVLDRDSLSRIEERLRSSGLPDQLKTGGAPLTLRPVSGVAEAPPSTESNAGAKSLWTNKRAERAEPDPALERIQTEFELGRAYVAAQVLRERLELAGLDELAARARRIQEEISGTFARIGDDDELQEVPIAPA